jgi:hypothetical protein
MQFHAALLNMCVKYRAILWTGVRDANAEGEDKMKK